MNTKEPFQIEQVDSTRGSLGRPKLERKNTGHPTASPGGAGAGGLALMEDGREAVSEGWELAGVGPFPKFWPCFLCRSGLQFSSEGIPT